MNFSPEVSKIKEDFDKVIKFSQAIPEPKTDKLFECWLESKRSFIESFGGKFIFEVPELVSFELDEKEKLNRIIRFESDVACRWNNEELAEFIDAQKEGFFKNVVVNDYVTQHGKKITKGTRLVKSFSHFVNDERSLADIQNEASRIIQEDKVSGTLCFSVHPLDYLSSSENTYNWRSCHSLDGEYRAGNLSYMMDEHTVVCYLKGSDSAILPNFSPDVPWNSKKWRVLLFFDSSWKMIIAGRQYPFESKSGMDIVLNKMTSKDNINSDKIASFNWSNWLSVIKPKILLPNGFEICTEDEFLPIGRKLKPIQEVVFNGKGSKQFNDLLSSTCYTPIFTVQYSKSLFEIDKAYVKTREDRTKFNIGGFTYCLWCGEKEVASGSDSMMCEECFLEHGDDEQITICELCGRRIYSDDAYWVDDEPWCEECYDEYAVRCESCGLDAHKDSIFYDEETKEYLCADCYKELLRERDWEEE